MEHNGSLNSFEVLNCYNTKTTRIQKVGWLYEVLTGEEEIKIRENEPLTQLLCQFARLLSSEWSGMDHTVLHIFEVALNGKWPQGDRCILFKPSESNQVESTVGYTRTSKECKYGSGLNPPPSDKDKCRECPKSSG